MRRKELRLKAVKETLAKLAITLTLCFGPFWSTNTVAVNELTEQEPAPTYRIYLDADMTNNAASGNAIELGILSALSEVAFKLDRYKVELVVKDHHGSTPRSQDHLQDFLQDPRALLVFGGMHSPPLIKSRDFINRNKILTLVPWAAATPITRSSSDDNWIFRLSLDDSKAGKVIVNDAVKILKRPFLLLEDTGWGRANKLTMGQALSEHNIVPTGTHFFQWGIGQFAAHAILENAIRRGADGFILVANAPEAMTFTNVLLSLTNSKQRPIYSHWGITGNDFPRQLGLEKTASLDLKFIQTRFSFFDRPQKDIAKRALASAARILQKESVGAEDIKAPAGFIHAYDLTRLLIAASQETRLMGDAKRDSVAIKKSLETLQTPVEGLIKTYRQAFTPFNASSPDAHEALNERDFTMARYDAAGNIRLDTEAKR